MRQIIEVATIWGVGFALPFIGGTLASIRLGEFPHPGLEEYWCSVFLLETLNLIPVVLCVICYKKCTILKKLRYAPICAVYLFVIYIHYKAALAWEGPFAWLIIIEAPILAIPVFFVVLVFSILFAWFFGVIEKSLSNENTQFENEVSTPPIEVNPNRSVDDIDHDSP